MSRLLAVLIASALFSFGAHAADPAAAKADYQRQLDTVKALTSALKNDSSAGTPAVKSILSLVEERQSAAQELASIGEYGLANGVLDEGYKKLTESLVKAKSVASSAPAVSSSGGQTVNDEKGKSEYERMVLSADALMDASKRLNAEKNNSHGARITSLEAQLSKAKVAGQKQDWNAATQLLNEVLAGQREFIAGNKTDSSTAGLKSGNSASRGTAEGAEMSASVGREQYAKTLKSTSMLTELIVRRSKERNIDNSAVLGQIEKLLGDAKKTETTDLSGAHQSAKKAYEVAKVSAESLFVR